MALTEATVSGAWVRKHHYSRVTKRYGALCTVDHRGSGVASFLRACGGDRVAGAWGSVGLSKPVIDTYLDAKSEGDFLQVRALKLVVAVEMFKAAFSERSGAASLVVSSEIFDHVLPVIRGAAKKTLLGRTTTPDQRKAIYANLFGVNRTPFPSQLLALCEAVRMPLGTDDIGRFVASRNKVVHEGYFYCERATDQEKARLAPLASVEAEWFWLLHFVDRLFLRAIDYAGTYIDWSIPSGPEPRELRPAPSRRPSGPDRAVIFSVA